MSIRYKIILSLLFLTATCLGIYILIAKSVFEKDKELGIYESTSQTSSARAQTLKQSLDDNLSFAQSIANNLEKNANQLSPSAQELFSNKKNLVSMGIYSNGGFIFFESKDQTITRQTLAQKITKNMPTVSPFNETGVVLVATEFHAQTNTGPSYLILTIDLKDNLDMLEFIPDKGGSFLAIGGHAYSNKSNFPFEFAQSIIATLPPQENISDQTGLGTIDGKDYLLSSRNAQFGDLLIYSIIPKDLAFLGLNRLYDKSIKFFALIFFIVLCVSVFMTQSLLKNLDKLTGATAAVSNGQFDVSIGVNSKDEFGVLATSFQKMSQEIKRLIVETKEKARMESELKTAQAVQENLFPVPKLQNSILELAGLYRPASECGGDWWFYFEHPTGTYVLICDATGHGAPAALITAAAKATVNLMKKGPQLTIEKLVSAFNYALYETARGNILMTGFVMHVRHDLSIDYINASHEPPIIIGDKEIKFIIDPIGPRFGESLSAEFKVGKVENIQGKTIVLYTDGITGQTNPKGRAIGDKRFTKFLNQYDFKTCNLSDVNTDVFKMVDEFRQEAIQEDDLTIVTVRFA